MGRSAGVLPFGRWNPGRLSCFSQRRPGKIGAGLIGIGPGFFEPSGPFRSFFCFSLESVFPNMRYTEWRCFGLILGAWLLVVAIFFTLRPSKPHSLYPHLARLDMLPVVHGPAGRLWRFRRPAGAPCDCSHSSNPMVPLKKGASFRRRGLALKDGTTLRSILQPPDLKPMAVTDLRFSPLRVHKSRAAKRILAPPTSKSKRSFPSSTETKFRGLPLPISNPMGLSVSLDLRGLPVEGYRTLYHAVLSPGSKARSSGTFPSKRPEAAYRSDSPSRGNPSIAQPSSLSRLRSSRLAKKTKRSCHRPICRRISSPARANG